MANVSIPIQLFTLGINHKTAPIALRERLAFSLEQLKPALHTLQRLPVPSILSSSTQNAETAILSTCNRVEIYYAAPIQAEQTTAIQQLILEWLSDQHRLSAKELKPCLYLLPQLSAVRHAFRVASGLESMMLGETQIVRQMKNAMQLASEAGTLGAYLNQLFQTTFSVAKEVRAQTEIGTQAISIAAIAVKIAQRIFEDIRQQRILFIGAGEMIHLCLTHFAAQAPHSITIANRSAQRSAALAKQAAAATMLLSELPQRLAEFDIIISCTASTLPILGQGAIQRALKIRKRRPILLLDLAVPRDIEPEIAQLPDIFLYTLDDLGAIAQQGYQHRQTILVQAETIIEARVQHFKHWLETRSVVPAILKLRAHADQLKNKELIRAQKMLARGIHIEQVLATLSDNLTQKLLHLPTHALNHIPSAQRTTILHWIHESMGKSR